LHNVYINNKNVGIVSVVYTHGSGVQDVIQSSVSPYPIESERITLGCALFKKEDFIKVGKMDENFPNKGGNYADDDLSKRFVEKGYINIIAPHLVFHYPSMTYYKKLLDHSEDLQKGRQYYEKKWNI